MLVKQCTKYIFFIFFFVIHLFNLRFVIIKSRNGKKWRHSKQQNVWTKKKPGGLFVCFLYFFPKEKPFFFIQNALKVWPFRYPYHIMWFNWSTITNKLAPPTFNFCTKEEHMATLFFQCKTLLPSVLVLPSISFRDHLFSFIK